VLNWDLNEANRIFYHGDDFRFKGTDHSAVRQQFLFYVKAIFRYDLLHFANVNGMHFGFPLHDMVRSFARPYDEIRILRRLGKRIVYSHSGCLDGVSQTSFRSWEEPPVCDICRWRNVPTVCSDERNLVWGKVRNELADFQCNLGGNRLDFNDDGRVHEVPEFYCLDPDFWDPGTAIPPQRRLPQVDGLVRLYHAVGNFFERTDAEQVNIKSTHVYVPLVRELKRDGFNVELMFFHDVPNTEIRFYQMQADVVLDMLSYGWPGATAREAMMLGKPVVCYLRPAWLASAREQIPEYVDALPIVNATASNIRSVLIDLITHPEKREEIGRRSREFAVKWHSSAAGACRLSQVYEALLAQ
jgi:glycosyltransferase involved in cell wall biosynthesis